MFLDASAIIAMLGDEADGDIFADALSAAETRLTSPIAIWEAVAGLVREYALSVREARAKVADFLAIAGINTVALGSSELAVAIDAYDQFGKGRHPARLNMGDCFARGEVPRRVDAAQGRRLLPDRHFLDVGQAMMKRLARK